RDGWGLGATSMMTNGNVDQTVTAKEGQVLTVKYKDGEKKITVPSEAPIVTFVPGERSELKPGAAIFIAAARPQPDGTLQAPRIAVGRGITPPMRVSLCQFASGLDTSRRPATPRRVLVWPSRGPRSSGRGGARHRAHSALR